MAEQIIAPGTALSLAETLDIAIARDVWGRASQARQEALVQEGLAADTLPNPQFGIAASNFPTDHFHIDQEAMTQWQVSVKQTFPRGDSRTLTGQRFKVLSAAEPLGRELRDRELARQVTLLWLNVSRDQALDALLAAKERVIQRREDYLTSSTAEGILGATQVDLLNTALQRVQLKERRLALAQNSAQARGQLSEWLGADALRPIMPLIAPGTPVFTAPEALILSLSDKALAALTTDPDASSQWLNDHPQITRLDKQIEALQVDIALAEQSFKPEWALSASYGYRADDPMGRERADLMSFGVSFDVPLVNRQQQDSRVSAAKARLAAAQTDRIVTLRQLSAALQQYLQALVHSTQRRQHIQTTLLPLAEQAVDAAIDQYAQQRSAYLEQTQATLQHLDIQEQLLRAYYDELSARANARFYLEPSVDINGRVPTGAEE
jgi:outer membrane protein TolC